MLSLDNILNKLYPPEEAEKAYEILKELKFYGHLNSCIDCINSKAKTEDAEISKFGVVQLGAIASSLLSGINEKLRSTSKHDFGNEIEQILIDISKSLLEYILQNFKSDKSKMVNQIAFSLHDTCLIYNYHEETVLSVLDFRSLQHYANVLLRGEKIIMGTPAMINAKSTMIKLPFYKWVGPANKRDQFIGLFSDKELILSNRKRNFHKLFESCDDNLSIDFNPDKARLLMTFFYHLKKSENKLLMAPKEGFYAPLLQHGFDFQNRILGNKPPGQFNDLMKKNRAEWTENTIKVKKWLKEISEK